MIHATRFAFHVSTGLVMLSETDSPPQLDKPPTRVVSLSPALTESLFDLGLGDMVVGVSDWCRYPGEALDGLPRVGGVGSADMPAIVALEPDLVLLSQWPHRTADVQALQAAGLPLWAPDLDSVRAGIDMLWKMVRLFGQPQAGLRISALETTLEWTSMAAYAHDPAPVFCPLSQEPKHEPVEMWLTAGDNSYLSDLLAVCGGRNVFAGSQSAAANGSASGVESRAVRVTPAQVVDKAPHVILIPAGAPDSPDAALFDDLTDLPAVRFGRVHVVDAGTLTWPGTRLARALQELPPLLHPE